MTAAVPPVQIDLGSDTATRPTAPMLQAMVEAKVGDEQLGEDPTTRALEERVAGLLGQESAVFLPSGTMCNQIALLVHCRAGDEIIAARQAHIYGSEGAGAAALAGAFIRPIDTLDGIFAGPDVSAAMRPARARAPRSRVVVVEQTSNRGGGAVWPLERVEEVAAAARANTLALHMDGARLLNAVIASGVAAHDFGRLCDSVWIDFSKGLGCPVGGVLAGSREFIEQGWVWKHRLGGAMRQSGVLAAACMHALEHHVDRLVQDHDNARYFARLVSRIEGVRLAFPVVTNIVFVDLSATGLEAAGVLSALRMHGVRLSLEGRHMLRAVTHLDIDAAGVERAAEALSAAINATAPRNSAAALSL